MYNARLDKISLKSVSLSQNQIRRCDAITCTGAPLAHVGEFDFGAFDALHILKDVTHRFALHRVDLK